MASFLNRLMSATVAAVSTWRSVFSDPQANSHQSHTDRQTQYDVLWSYYANTAFEDLDKWHQYRSEFALYRHIRSIYNPVQRIVDFYVGHVYPGVLSSDGSRLPAGIQLAIPLAEDTDPNLKEAIAQFWQWGNWQEGSGLMVTYGAVTGNVLVELLDDVARSKVLPSVTWPGLVSDLEIDITGNVQFYALEYEAENEDGTKFQYRKEVDQDEFRFFKDDKPFDYGQGASYANPYGFVPAVWVKHGNQGGDFGVPAIKGSISKIDELNALASHINDHIHKLINAPQLITTEGNIGPLFAGAPGSDQRGVRTIDPEMTTLRTQQSFWANREKIGSLKAPAGTEVKSLAGNLQLDHAMPYVDHLMSEIEQDFPELTFYQQLRSMSQITGPAADRLMGDVKQKVLRAASSYDLQSTKLFAMAVAIGGWRLSRGDWSMRTAQQEKFGPFNLESYAKGDLNFEIVPRPLITVNEEEQIGIDLKRAQMVTAKQDFIDEEQILTELNYSDEQIKEIMARKKVERKDKANLGAAALAAFDQNLPDFQQ